MKYIKLQWKQHKTSFLTLQRKEVKLSKGTFEEVDLEEGSVIAYRVRRVGLYLVVESEIGLAVMWDRKTTIRILLEPQHSVSHSICLLSDDDWNLSESIQRFDMVCKRSNWLPFSDWTGRGVWPVWKFWWWWTEWLHHQGSDGSEQSVRVCKQLESVKQLPRCGNNSWHLWSKTQTTPLGKNDVQHYHWRDFQRLSQKGNDQFVPNLYY